MEKKKFIIYLLLGLYLISFVGAVNEDVGISEKDVRYDKQILDQFNFTESEKKNFVRENLKDISSDVDLVHVTIKIQDNTNINFSKDDSDNQFRDKLDERTILLNATTNSILYSLSNDEFQLERVFPLGNGFYGNITKEGFGKLLNDERVRKIYAEKEIYSSLGESVQLINADDAWNLGYNGSEQTICVIDSGVNYSHPDLGGCFGSGCKVIGGYDYVDDDSDPMDEVGHGTKIAGILVSQDEDNRGIVPEADIVSLRATGGIGFYQGEVISALQWCFNNKNIYNISIVSMSFGGANGLGDCGEDYADDEIGDLSDVGISLVACSGNNDDYSEIDYPACNSEVISVGATYDFNYSEVDWCDEIYGGTLIGGVCWEGIVPHLDFSCVDTPIIDEISCWSNRGNLLDLLSPGSSITTTNINGGFSSASGTSASAPMVAGAAALLLEKNSSLEPDDIKQILQNTGVDIYDSETESTFKRIDVLAALNSICTCEDWIIDSCGGGGCEADEMHYTRNCSDSCDIESKCEYNTTCDSGTPNGVDECKYSDVLSSYCDELYDAIDSDCYWDGDQWECELECHRDTQCGDYGSLTEEHTIITGWDGSGDRDVWYDSQDISTDTSHCYKFFGRTDFDVSDWGSADSYTLFSRTDWDENSACKTASGTIATDMYELSPGTGSSYDAEGKAYDYGASDCTGGTPLNDLEGTLTSYIYYQTADWYTEDTEYLYCDVPYTDDIIIGGGTYTNQDSSCYVKVDGDVSDPEKIRIQWYVNGNRVDIDHCDDGGSYEECDDDSGSFWNNNFTLDSSEFEKGDEIYCIGKGYGEDEGYGAYKQSSTRTVLNTVPTFSGIDLNPELAKEGDLVQMTANGESDLDNDTLGIYCCNGDSCTPTISNHNFCYAVGDYYPYNLSCTGQAVNGSETQTVRCRVYDGDDYSSIQSDTYNLDNIPPNVTIISPLNQTYGYSSINFNVSLYENGSCIYSLDNGITNISMTSENNRDFGNTNSTMGIGSYTVNYYCNDSLGNLNSTESVGFTLSNYSTLTNCYNITISGTYILQEDILNSSVSECMNIQADNVLLDCQDYLIQGNGTASSGIYVSRDSAIDSNITIKNCNLENWIFGIWFSNSNSNLLENNHINNNSYGLFLDQSSNFIINNSVLMDNDGYDFINQVYSDEDCNNILENITGTDNKPIVYFNYSVNLKNWGNNASEIILCNADNSQLDNITLDKEGIKNNALFLIRTDNSNLSNITINNFYRGINEADCNGNSLRDIFVENTSEIGFWSKSNNTKMSQFTLTNNPVAGTYLFGSNGFQVSDSLFEDNNYGIYLVSSSNNTINSSYIYDNNVGIQVWSYSAIGEAKNNHFYNNFLNNTINSGFNNPKNNSWNITKTSGLNIINGDYIAGNFWAYPNGTGFSESCNDADKDGICDNPLELEISNVDYSPLTQVFPNDTHLFVHKDSSGNVVAWLGDEGNIALKGSCFSGGSCDNPGEDSFIIKNITGDIVAFINSTGDLCVEVGDCTDQSASCNSMARDGFIIKNQSGGNAIYIDWAGDLCLTGELFEGYL